MVWVDLGGFKLIINNIIYLEIKGMLIYSIRNMVVTYDNDSIMSLKFNWL